MHRLPIIIGALLVALVAAGAAMAGGYDIADLYVSQAGTNAAVSTFTNATMREGTVEVVDVLLSGYASPTCTVTLATVTGGIRAQTIMSETFTASRAVYPLAIATTNGVAVDWRPFAIAGNKLVLSTTAGNSTGIVVNVRVLMRDP